ncbi:MAG: sigma-70 family RNA polymerase sigma factor [Clostridia bacterium]
MKTTAEQFTELCAPYSAMVYRHCLHVLRSPQEAEDAAQESLLRAFRAFGGFRGTGVATWLFRIAHNTCLDVIKSSRYKHETVTLDEWREVHGDPADCASTPEEAYEQASANEALWQAVAALPEEQQVLLSLCYGQNMSYEELASATGLRVGTVKSKLNRAKASLREKMIRNGLA